MTTPNNTVAGLPVPALVFYTHNHFCDFADGVEILSTSANFYSEEQMQAALASPAPSAGVGAPKIPVPADAMEARSQGRAEALAIVLGLDAEEGLSEYTQSIPPGPAGEWGTSWDEEKLRELFRADDTAWSLLQEAEGEYWRNLGLREEAERLRTLQHPAAPSAPPSVAGDAGERLNEAAANVGHLNFNSMTQCADSWLAVNGLLHELVPDWTNNDLTGREAALAAIRRLAAALAGKDGA